MFKATVLTLFPEMFPAFLGHSLAEKARASGVWDIETVALREFGIGKHKVVDDTPAGGGAGMVLRADVIAAAFDARVGQNDTRPRYVLSPRGRFFQQRDAAFLAEQEGVVLLCGRFEGIDQRVIEARHFEEISIGSYILSGGEPAALVMLDAIIRLLPGVMGNALSGVHESYTSGRLEHPQYTRPQDFEGLKIPDVLNSGHHAAVEKWREEMSKDVPQ